MVSSGIWCLMFARHIVNVAFKHVWSAIQSIPFCTHKGNRKAEQNSWNTDTNKRSQ